MSKQIGDKLIGSVRRALFEDIEWQIDRGTPTWESLWPSKTMSGLVETEIGHTGLDGRFFVQYYEQSLQIGFLQTDDETLADLYSTALTTLLHTTGVPTRITLAGGQTIELTMYFRRTLRAAGYNTTLVVELEGRSSSLSPMLA